MAGQFTAAELEDLAVEFRDMVTDFVPQGDLRFRYERLLEVDEVVADGADFVVTFDDGRTLRYQPIEEDE